VDILITGGTGYIGGRLVPELLAAGHRVRCLARTPAKLDAVPWRSAVEVVEGDVTEPESVARAMTGMDAAYFLVHSMGGDTRDFAENDRRAAATFRDAAATSGTVQQLIYLGGLGDDADPTLSTHLRSRHEVGATLAAGPVPVTELRAAIIIGSGSASFEMLRNLAEVLPVMVTPRWVDTRCQPIAVRDVLFYLVGVLGLEGAMGQVLEIGGPDVLTYSEMLQEYAAVAGLRRRLLIRVPVLTPRLSSHWVGLVTPIPGPLARPLIDSLVNEVVVRDHRAAGLLPRDPLPYRKAVELALQRVRDLDVATTWAGADFPGRAGQSARRSVPGRSAAHPLPTDPDWAGGTVLSNIQSVHSDAGVDRLFATVSGLGGHRGWYAANALWNIRGVMDRILGGPGMRRGRRHPDQLRVGDTVDFWRVEVLEPGRLLRLRAEMRLPGEAWLEFRTAPDQSGQGSVLDQRARFLPRGVAGRLYWYALLPFHALIFAPLARRLAFAATLAPSDPLHHVRVRAPRRPPTTRPPDAVPGVERAPGAAAFR